jgi:hypothetical protein
MGVPDDARHDAGISPVDFVEMDARTLIRWRPSLISNVYEAICSSGGGHLETIEFALIPPVQALGDKRSR